MYISEIVEINNYRNLTGKIITFNDTLNFLIGENNIGKTNILELINICFAIGKFAETDFMDITLPIKIKFKVKYSNEEIGYFEDNFDVDDSNSITLVAMQDSVDERINYYHDTPNQTKISMARDCVENFQPSHLKASVLVKNLQSDHEEDDFIVKGIEKIVSTKENKVAVLVRAGWQGNSVAQILDQKGIPYFNALFKETDPEYISFYNIALEEFHNNVLGKAVQRNLKNCLLAVDARRNEIYQQESKKYIFESMYKLLEILFVESKKVSGTSRDRYDYIDFILGNKGLKHMMEFVDEQVVLTTIHAAKGLEWEYVIIPRLNGFAFPSSHMCRPCKEANSCNEGFDYCKFTYAQSLKKAFKEELSILYVGITRAKKNAFFTVNTGANKWNHSKTTSCLLNLEGLILEDYEWENVI